MLRARRFRVCRKFLRARYTHAYERACNFLRPGDCCCYVILVQHLHKFCYDLCDRGPSF